MAARHNAALRFRFCSSFRESHSEIGTDDADLVDRIYRTCAIVHEWRCHAVVDGYFFKCPESYFVPTVLGPRTEHRWEDGIRISDDPAFAVELRNYLAATVPLYSCGRCLGTAGRRFAHNQLREGWRTPQQRPAEELIDQRLLARAEQRQFVMSRLRALIGKEFAQIRRAVRPGGLFVAAIHVEDAAGSEAPHSFLLAPGELRALVGGWGWEVVHAREGASSETGHRHATAEIVARRPR